MCFTKRALIDYSGGDVFSEKRKSVVCQIRFFPVQPAGRSDTMNPVHPVESLNNRNPPLSCKVKGRNKFSRSSDYQISTNILPRRIEMGSDTLFGGGFNKPLLKSSRSPYGFYFR